MATVTQLITAAEFYEFCQRPENVDRRFELERGEVIEWPPPGIRHGVVCGNVVWLLGSFVRQRRKGYIVSNDAGLIVERDPDTVYGPDTFLYDEHRSYEDLETKYDDRPPALVVMVLSPTDRPGRVMRQIRRFHEMGVPLVWVVDPEARNVTAYRTGQQFLLLEEHEEITGLDAIPDLRLPVADFFAMPEQPDEDAAGQ